MAKIRVGVLFGGKSAEHEVSLQSARSVLEAIDRNKYQVVPIGVTQQGQWVMLNDPLLNVDKPVTDDDGAAVTLLPSPSNQELLPLTQASPSEAGPLTQLDVIFPVIHGTFGEDGTVQGLFELADIPYVGCGVLGSAVGMDKAIMKALFAQAGLPQTPHQVILRKQWQCEPDAVREQCEANLNYPWFVKPANLGSSVGITKVNSSSDFKVAMTEAARYDRKIIIEQSVENAHEIEVSVLGNDEPQASVPGEILPNNEFYDYRAKYIDGTSGLVIPAKIPESVTQQLQDYAIRAFQALDGSGLARVDFLVRRESHEIYILEANTMPGFTSISMYPKLWQASGLSYPELIERLIELALDRHRERQQNQTRLLPSGS